jgi:hypothetical protein
MAWRRALEAVFDNCVNRQGLVVKFLPAFTGNPTEESYRKVVITLEAVADLMEEAAGAWTDKVEIFAVDGGGRIFFSNGGENTWVAYQNDEVVDLGKKLDLKTNRVLRDAQATGTGYAAVTDHRGDVWAQYAEQVSDGAVVGFGLRGKG